MSQSENIFDYLVIESARKVFQSVEASDTELLRLKLRVAIINFANVVKTRASKEEKVLIDELLTKVKKNSSDSEALFDLSGLCFEVISGWKLEEFDPYNLEEQLKELQEEARQKAQQEMPEG